MPRLPKDVKHFEPKDMMEPIEGTYSLPDSSKTLPVIISVGSLSGSDFKVVVHMEVGDDVLVEFNLTADQADELAQRLEVAAGRADARVKPGLPWDKSK